MEHRSSVYELEDSDEPIREILGKIPSWMVRWGNTLVLLFFLSLVAISMLIKYPESVYTNATLASINAPKPVISNIAGKLVKLKAQEGQSISKGDIIGFMECVGDHKQVLDLYAQINQLRLFVKQGDFEKIRSLDLKYYKDLGDLQQPFQVFSQASVTYSNYLAGGLYPKKRTMLKTDLDNLALLQENLKSQKRLYEQDLSLSQQTFKANESLMEEKLISSFDYRIEKSKLIAKSITLPQIEGAIIGNEALQNEKKKEMLELENTITKQNLIFQEALNIFNGQIEDWMKKYILTAPMDGKIVFNSFLQENQQLQANQIICYINPGDSQYFAEAYIPQANFGKVSLGQRVLLRFPSYPYQEYGMVEGKIDFVSHIGTNEGYLSKITLSEDLSTTTNKKIQYKEGMMANAEIITKDMNLIDRFYYTILRLRKY